MPDIWVGEEERGETKRELGHIEPLFCPSDDCCKIGRDIT